MWRTVRESVVDCSGQSRRVLGTVEDRQGECSGLCRTVKEGVVVEDSLGECCRLWRIVTDRVVDCRGESRIVL